VSPHEQCWMSTSTALTNSFTPRSLHATARDFHGFTRQMTFARLVLSTSSHEPMPSFAANLLPQRQAITPLIQHYLDCIHILYPFLSETNLFAAVAAVYERDERCAASPMDHWITRMVLAITLASWSRRRGDTQYQNAVRHAAGAFEHIEDVVHPGSLAGIQAILLMVIYSMFDPHHLKSWNLIGLASRAMVDIGLHQDPPADVPLKGTDHEISRRLYASIYSLDRSTPLLCDILPSVAESRFAVDQLVWSTVEVSPSRITPPVSLPQSVRSGRTATSRSSCMILMSPCKWSAFVKSSRCRIKGFFSHIVLPW